MTTSTRDMLATMSLPVQLPPDLQHIFAEAGQSISVPAGTSLYRPGEEMGSFLIVGDGSIRVFKTSDDGREITLYHVGGSQCCTLNVLCLLSDRPSPASAFVEKDVQALAFTPEHFRDWFVRHAALRDLVIGQMADRVHLMMTLVEEVAFQKLDSRLATYLLAAADKAGRDTLVLTHEAIAMELGSVREVVSRLLKSFESAGLVALGRGRNGQRNVVGRIFNGDIVDKPAVLVFLGGIVMMIVDLKFDPGIGQTNVVAQVYLGIGPIGLGTAE